jgi:hypothetical protein
MWGTQRESVERRKWISGGGGYALCAPLTEEDGLSKVSVYSGYAQVWCFPEISHAPRIERYDRMFMNFSAISFLAVSGIARGHDLQLLADSSRSHDRLGDMEEQENNTGAFT